MWDFTQRRSLVNSTGIIKNIIQNMLTNLPDPKFQLLGTQILYQKVSN